MLAFQHNTGQIHATAIVTTATSDLTPTPTDMCDQDLIADEKIRRRGEGQMTLSEMCASCAL